MNGNENGPRKKTPKNDSNRAGISSNIFYGGTFLKGSDGTFPKEMNQDIKAMEAKRYLK